MYILKHSRITVSNNSSPNLLTSSDLQETLWPLAALSTKLPCPVSHKTLKLIHILTKVFILILDQAQTKGQGEGIYLNLFLLLLYISLPLRVMQIKTLLIKYLFFSLLVYFSRFLLREN